MATTFDVNRIGGGTFELVQDPATGKYTVKQVGFTPVKKLTLPDYTTAASTAGTTDTSKATTEATTQTVAQQTTEAFRPTGGGEAIDYTGGEMLSQAQLQKEAKKIDPQVDTTITSLGIARPTMKDIAGDTTEEKKQEQQKNYVAGYKSQTTSQPMDVKEQYAVGNLPKDELDFSEPAVTFQGPYSLGVSKVAAQPQKLQTERFAGATTGTLADPAEKEDVKPEAPVTGLSKVKTGLETLAKSVGKVLTSGPVMTLAKAAFTETRTQKFDKSYFTDRGDGRIGGNPTTDLYAGFNRVSAFGDLERAGRNRIATREKTIEKKGYKPGDKFYDDTQNMKDQQRDYQKAKEKKTSSARERARMNQPGSGGDGSGSSNEGRVICTELNKTGELSTADLVRDIRFTYRHLSKKHLKGYLAWAIPTVRHIQKFKTYRKVWKHIAQHRANDIAWRMNQGKFDLLGRIYAGIGEPLCWLIGNFVSDKNYNLLNTKRNRHL